jgi:hypothetical protein
VISAVPRPTRPGAAQ